MLAIQNIGARNVLCIWDVMAVQCYIYVVLNLKYTFTCSSSVQNLPICGEASHVARPILHHHRWLLKPSYLFGIEIYFCIIFKMFFVCSSHLFQTPNHLHLIFSFRISTCFSIYYLFFVATWNILSSIYCLKAKRSSPAPSNCYFVTSFIFTPPDQTPFSVVETPLRSFPRRLMFNFTSTHQRYREESYVVFQ